MPNPVLLLSFTALTLKGFSHPCEHGGVYFPEAKDMCWMDFFPCQNGGFSMLPSCISYQGCFSALCGSSLAEVTEVVLGCDAAQQANLSKPLMQPLVGWESRLKVTSIF